MKPALVHPGMLCKADGVREIPRQKQSVNLRPAITAAILAEDDLIPGDDFWH